MKYSKQRLATAMAATMVVSMVPAMAFAAPLDDVVKALGEENVNDTKAGNFKSAKDAATKAAPLATDMKSRAVLAAYNASIEVLEANTFATWDAAKVKFDAAVNALKGVLADNMIAGGFGHAQTKANHDRTVDGVAVAAAGPVVAAIEALPATVAAVDKAAIEGARKAYNELDARAKVKVAPEKLAKLEKAEADLKALDQGTPGAEELAGLTFTKETLFGDVGALKVSLPDSIKEGDVTKEQFTAKDADGKAVTIAKVNVVTAAENAVTLDTDPGAAYKNVKSLELKVGEKVYKVVEK